MVILYVPQTYGTIVAAVAACNNGDIISIADGTYEESVVVTNSITIRSQSGSRESCIINGDGFSTVIEFTNVTFTVENVTISGGYCGFFNENYGAGIRAVNCIGTIDNCIFRNNECSMGWQGGGMYCSNSEMTVSDCLFEDNLSEGYGGGAIKLGHVDQSGLTNSMVIDRCIFRRNYCTVGGAIHAQYTNLTTNSCLFYDNSCDSGAGAIMFNNDNTLVINKCTIVHNTSTASVPGVSLTGLPGAKCDVTVRNSILYGNEGGADKQIYSEDDTATIVAINCDIENLDPLDFDTVTACIDADPLFADEDNDIFRLTFDSPCFNTGTSEDYPDADLLGITVPQGPYSDMGCYELVYPIIVPSDIYDEPFVFTLEYGEAYRKMLESLLPRGIAWSRK